MGEEVKAKNEKRWSRAYNTRVKADFRFTFFGHFFEQRKARSRAAQKRGSRVANERPHEEKK